MVAAHPAKSIGVLTWMARRIGCIHREARKALAHLKRSFRRDGMIPGRMFEVGVRQFNNFSSVLNWALRVMET